MAKYNWYFILNVIIIACGGIPKGSYSHSHTSIGLYDSETDNSINTGYDEGGFSASVGLPSFKNDFNLNTASWKKNPAGLANRKANISSFGVLGAAFGSLLALLVIDRIGRLKSYRLFLAVWASGILMQVFSSGIFGFMLFARIWGGLGAGGLTVVSPLFLSEIAKARSRGFVVSCYMLVLLTFLTLGKP
jgi:MFS family permease